METATIERSEQAEEVAPVEPVPPASSQETPTRIDRDPPLHIAETAMKAVAAYEADPLPPIDQGIVRNTRDIVRASGGQSGKRAGLKLGRISLSGHRSRKKEIKLETQSLNREHELPTLGIGRTISALRSMKRTKGVSHHRALRRTT